MLVPEIADNVSIRLLREGPSGRRWNGSGGRNSQLVRGHFLQGVSRVVVEEEEERLVAEVADLCPGWWWLDVVARREVELGLDVERKGRL